MLPLNDPLWTKLDDAHCDRDIPALLRSLAETWNDDAANSLFYDCLCHQETCYGATYASIPHLIKIAQRPDHHHQRLEIAVFLGIVVLNALEPHENDDEDSPCVLPNGLPSTLDEWDKRLDVLRRFAESFSGQARGIRTIPPIDARDLRKIERVRAEFFAALPAVRDICERAFLENPEDDVAHLYLLSGVAAADRQVGLARLLSLGVDGDFRCSSCGWHYSHLFLENRLAVYEDDELNATLNESDLRQRRSLDDFKEGVPSRCDGFVEPAADSDPVDPCVAELFALATRAPSARPALLLRHFLGSFLCIHCGSRGPICGS
ncbi:MAG TPA: hypothetical protein VII40_13660 [Xanthobacteraceae bacterium]